jgi:hypothetical protein
MPTPSYEQFGDQTYQFGIADANTTLVAGMAVEQITVTGTPEFEAMAKNATGMTAAYVRGLDKYEFSASGYITDEAAFDGNSNFEYAGRFFIINKREKADSNVDFRKCNITGVAFALIEAPV